ncbi:Arabinose transporter [Anaerobiospirillum thomasii]|uniref:Arabinose transporter n=1 Tax=Anaerobiospirillum thomasii TaxID=179995 RepID=A0A2X0W046_9GAMM|nr:MFS transporter [Anaerobiospirillum thomasii]SPT69692.1 Arabinose transporter [Anaerobiospirillum thomasii]SPT71749.1 Arabinose transporter [Anaerobiospirillum thomasii]SPT78906.1 Arabinose transporter [Anaerobiospirillum thomasii]
MKDDITSSYNVAMIPLKYSLLVAFFALSFGFSIANQFFTTDINSILFGTSQPILLISFGTTMTGAAIGIFLGAWLTYESGRKVIILSSALFGMFAFVAASVASNLSLFLSAYFVIGITFGLYFLSSYIYIAEITLSTHRGMACSFIVSMFVTGFMLSKCLSSMQGIANMAPFLIAYIIVNLIIFIIAFIKLPESPRWLSLVGLSDSALNVLFKLRQNMGMAAHELAAINESSRREFHGAHLFFQNQHFRKVLWLYGITALFLHMAGISFVPSILLFTMTDSLYLSEDLSLKMKDVMLYAIFLVFLAASLTVTFSIDKFGRRKLILFGISADSILLFLLWLVLASGPDGSSLSIIVLSLVFIFTSSLAAFSFLSSFVDITPNNARDFAGATVLFIYVSSILLNTRGIYLYSDYINVPLIVFVLLCCSVILAIVLKRYYPDTSNLSLEEIEHRIFQGTELIQIGNEVKKIIK